MSGARHRTCPRLTSPENAQGIWVSRRIDLAPDAVVIRYGGLGAALTLVRELRIPYRSIRRIEVGADDLPSPFTLRRIGLADPITGTRRGRFWTGGKKWFLDVRTPSRAVVLTVAPGSDYDAVAIETDLTEHLADGIRARLDAIKPPP
jgi:hypothetical protein